ncbi:MAG TPA: PP0621 family protein [Halomonas sp.]|nr:PP0621 family protein [Halomonas sp.]
MNLLLIRIIIFAVLFFAGLKLYRMYRKRKLNRDNLVESDSHQADDKMVLCTWCKVHVPEPDALREKGEWFCCSAHRDKYLEEKKDD